MADNVPGGEVDGKLNELRGSMAVARGTLGHKLQTLEDMVLAVSTMVEEAVAKLVKGMGDQKPDQWIDWGILDDQGSKRCRAESPSWRPVARRSLQPKSRSSGVGLRNLLWITRRFLR